LLSAKGLEAARSMALYNIVNGQTLRLAKQLYPERFSWLQLPPPPSEEY
jgi:hypothetical protein